MNQVPHKRQKPIGIMRVAVRKRTLLTLPEMQFISVDDTRSTASHWRWHNEVHTDLRLLHRTVRAFAFEPTVYLVF